jgi:hypothetical protein
MKNFNVKISHGSSPGYHHLDSYQGNQDGIFSIRNMCNNGIQVGVICDGCSSSDHPELGSVYFSQLIAECINERYRMDLLKKDEDENLEWLAESIISTIELMTVKIQSKQEFIKRNLLFTIIGFYIIDGIVTVFHYGDGVVYWSLDGAKDNRYIMIDQNNAPNYISYRKWGIACDFTIFQLVGFKCKHIIIGSDGIDYIHKNAGKKYHRNKTVPTLDEIANDEKVYRNPSLLTKKLQSLTKHRILFDDTSMFVIKVEKGQ